MAKSTVAVRFVGDTANLKRSLNDIDGGFGKVRQTAKIAAVGLAGALAVFGKQSVDAFVEAEKAQANLNAAFDKFPQLAGENADALRTLNSELAKKTQFDDDATASGQAVLAQFGLTADELAQITPLLQDYAAKTGQDLPTAAQALGKAVLGQGRALKSVGLNFKDTGSKAGNLEQLMGGLNEKVGGFAEVAGDTAAGKAQILSNQFGELQESVGSALVPVLTDLADVLVEDVLPTIENVGNWFSDHKPVMIAAAAAVGTLAAAFATVTVATKLWTAATTIWTGIQAVATAAQWAFNAALTANPIGLIVVAIAGFVAALVLAYQRVGWFRDFVDASFRLIKSVIETVFNWVKDNWKLLLAILTGPIGIAVGIIVTHWDTIKNAVMAAFNWVRDNWKLLLGILTGPIGAAAYLISVHWDSIKKGATAVYNWVRDKFNAVVQFFAELPGRIRAQVDRILDQLDRLLGPLDEIAGKIGDVAGSAVGLIPGFASGVTNFGGGLAVVGEDGPELVNLPRGSDVIPNGKFGARTPTAGATSTGMTVNLNIAIPPTMDAGAAGQAITEALAAYVRRNGANDLRLLLGV